MHRDDTLAKGGPPCASAGPRSFAHPSARAASGRAGAAHIVVPRTHALTFELTATERAAGYLAKCPECGECFIDAEAWASSDCVPTGAAA